MEETKEDVTYDREAWGPGPWDKEPDRVEFDHAGLPCLLLRNTMGNWCGYAAVPPGHPWHGIKYGYCFKGCKEVEAKPMEQIGPIPIPDSIQNWHLERKHFSCQVEYKSGHTPDDIIDVHGRLTYSGFCQGHICHAPKPGESDNVFWFGFDCAHAFDLVPGLMRVRKKDGSILNLGRGLNEDVYRDMAYVRRETEHLADQLAEAGRL